MRWIWFVLLTACPAGAPSTVPTVCTKAYEKCQLADGPLGVCDYGRCPDGGLQCLRCQPQH